VKLTVKYFAQLREQLGESETWAWPASAAPEAKGQPATVGALRQWLQGRSPAHAQALHDTVPMRAALNQCLCSADDALVDGAEVAFFPPVTGG